MPTWLLMPTVLIAGFYCETFILHSLKFASATIFVTQLIIDCVSFHCCNKKSKTNAFQLNILHTTATTNCTMNEKAYAVPECQSEYQNCCSDFVLHIYTSVHEGTKLHEIPSGMCTSLASQPFMPQNKNVQPLAAVYISNVFLMRT